VTDHLPDDDEVVGDQPARRPRRADTGASPRAARRSRRSRPPEPTPPPTDGLAAGDEPRTPEDLIPADEVDEAAEAPYPPTSGRRAGRSELRRRDARARTALVVVSLTAVAVAVILATFALVDRVRDQAEPEPVTEVPDAAPGDPQPAVTVITTRDGPDGPEVATIALLAVDRDSGEGTVLLVPPATIADVPGHGSFRLGEAFDFGGAALTGVSLDNLLGARTDAVVTVSEEGWAAFLDPLGPTQVTLAEPVVDRAEDGSGTVLLPAGSQEVGGDGLATMLAFRSGDESQLDQLPRAQAALLGVLDRVVADPAELDRLFADGAPQLEVIATAGADEEDGTEASADLVRTVLAELATARERDQLTTLTLFVSPLGTGTEDAYRPDADRITALVDERLAASRPDPGVAGGRTLQLLNGNGQPGIGADVAAVLQPAGYRVLLTGNADRFTYEVTRILVYDEDPDTLAAARDVRDRLGVGQIERSGTPQSVVDLTVVIGRDFPVGGADASADADEVAPSGEVDGTADDAETDADR
jgi:polyisoprenyl-teichoic acid--peptidoglycan teichoic acid transferase